MEFPRAFFDLNCRLARRAQAVGGMPLAEALLKTTHLYLAFGLGRSFDPAHPAWAEFAAGLEGAADPVDWIYATYTRLVGDQPPRRPERPFGCFSYALWEGGRVRLHFWNPDPGTSPLRREAVPERLADLRALLADVRSQVPEARSIIGGSWLYNIEPYRRLFPPEFLASAAAEPPEPQFISLWGQFLDHRGQVKEALAREFLARVEQAETLDEVLHSFPYPTLRLSAPVEVFYGYYGV